MPRFNGNLMRRWRSPSYWSDSSVYTKRQKQNMLVCGQTVILIPSPTPFPPIFLLFLSLFNMAPEIEFALSDFPPCHKTASYAGYKTQNPLQVETFCRCTISGMIDGSRNKIFSWWKTSNGRVKLKTVVSVVFSPVFNSNIKINWKFENPRGRPLVTSVYGCSCHGKQLDTMWFQLIESTNKAHDTC